MAEQCAVAAAVAVPLVFSVHTERIFEAEKAGLIRVLGAAALVAAISAWRLRAGHGSRPGAPSDRRRGMSSAAFVAMAFALVLVAEIVATIVSVAPAASIWGSYDRAQGLLTTVALAGLAAGASSLAARPGGPAQLADAIGLTVLPAGLYAVVQRAGLDPLPWLGDVVIRVSGPAGSSTLFAAHLVMALPFTALGVAAAWRAAARGEGAGRHLADVRLAVRLLALAIGASALILSGSRGPALGLAAGGAVAFLAWCAASGRPRHAIGMLAAAVGGIGLLVALNRAPGAFGPLVELPLVDRLSIALDPTRSTARVRLLLWDGSVDAVAADPVRALVGHGPETTELVWAPYYPSILAYDEPRGWVPDRAHTLVLDTLLTGGILGLAALLLLYGAAVLAGLEALGIVRRSRGASRRAAAAAMLAGGLLGGGAAGALEGAWRTVAPASGLGMVAGLAAWLTAVSRRAPLESRYRRSGGGHDVGGGREIGGDHGDRDVGGGRDDPSDGDDRDYGDHDVGGGREIGGDHGDRDVGGGRDDRSDGDGRDHGDHGDRVDSLDRTGFALAALAALTAHFVELQFSFAVGATRLVAYLLCGALGGMALAGIAAGRAFGAVPPGSVALDDVGPGGAPGGSAPRRGNGGATAPAPHDLPAIAAATLVYAFGRPGLADGGAVVASLLVATSAGGLALALSARTAELFSALRRAGLMTAAYTAVHLLLVAGPASLPEDAVAASAAALGLYVAALLALVAFAACAPDRTGPSGELVDSDGGDNRTERSATEHGQPGAGHGFGLRLGLGLGLERQRGLGPSGAAGLTVIAALIAAVPLWIAPSTADALVKEGRLAWEAPVAELRARGESGRAEALLIQARERYRRASALDPYQPRHAMTEAYAAVVHADVLAERLDRAASLAGLADAFDTPGGPGEYAPDLLDGDAARWAGARDARFEEALAHLDRAAALMGPSPLPPIARARALRVWAERTRASDLRSARLESAAGAYTVAIAAAPTWPEIREEAARAAVMAGGFDRAVELCTEALGVDPYYTRCHATIARAHSGAGDEAAAAASWAAYFADARNAGDAEGYRARLRTLLALGRTAAAIDAALDLLRLAPDDARAHADLAVLYEQSGDLSAARASAERAGRLAPGDPGIAELVTRLGGAP